MKKIVLTTLLLCSGNVLALDYFVQGGLHFGGDKLAQAQFTNGKSDSIKAGELISLSAGIGSEIIDGVEARVLAGAKFDTINAKNGDVIFLRYPIEALVLYQAGEKIYIGGGATYHLDPTLSGSGVASSADVNFDDALGFVLTGEYALSNGGYVGIKYTNIDYKAFGVTVSGNSIGGILGVRF